MTTSIFGSEVVAGFAERLLAVAEAPMEAAAESLFLDLLEDAGASDEQFDAAFLATQMLCDLGRLATDERLYVLGLLLNTRYDDWQGGRDACLAYYRDHGEGGLARMLEKNPELYELLGEEGRTGLLLRPGADEDLSVADDAPERISQLGERALALAASTPGIDRVDAWRDFQAAMKGLSVEARISAVRGLREQGTLSDGEYAGLVEASMRDRYEAAIEGDRQTRCERRLAKWPRFHGHEPLGTGHRRVRRPWRSERVRAACLRQVGEHRLADLLVTDPEGYSGALDQRCSERPRDRGEEIVVEADRDVLRGDEDDKHTVARYLQDVMTQADADAFEARLRSDDEYFGRMEAALYWDTRKRSPLDIRMRVYARHEPEREAGRVERVRTALSRWVTEFFR